MIYLTVRELKEILEKLPEGSLLRIEYYYWNPDIIENRLVPEEITDYGVYTGALKLWID